MLMAAGGATAFSSPLADAVAPALVIVVVLLVVAVVAEVAEVVVVLLVAPADEASFSPTRHSNSITSRAPGVCSAIYPPSDVNKSTLKPEVIKGRSRAWNFEYWERETVRYIVGKS